MQPIETVTTQCPYCGEEIELLVDCSVAAQEYGEDCSVCCRPMIIDVEVADDDSLRVDVRTEND